MPRAKLFYVYEFLGLVIICLTASYSLADAPANQAKPIGAASAPTKNAPGRSKPAASASIESPPGPQIVLATTVPPRSFSQSTDWPTDDVSGRSKIQSALDELTEMDFVDTPLKDVVDSLKARHKIEIQLDTKALNDAGVTPDTTFTRHLKGLPLRSAARPFARRP